MLKEHWPESQALSGMGMEAGAKSQSHIMQSEGSGVAVAVRTVVCPLNQGELQAGVEGDGNLYKGYIKRRLL